MITILYVALGVVFGFVLLILLIWIWLKWKFRKFAAEFAEEFEKAMSQMVRMAPPLRIDLEPLQNARWSDIDKIYLIMDALEELGYQPDGLFEAYAPVHVQIQGFKNSRESRFAALYEVKEYEVEEIGALYLDLVAELADGSQITVSNAPDDGLDRPPFSRIIRLEHLDLSEPEQIQELHQRLSEELQGQTIVDQADISFAEIFQKHWAQTMDWRMERGGVTSAEVIRITMKNGQPEPTEAEIEQVKRPWRQQIDLFITDQIRQDYLNQTNMSGREWEETLDRLVIVHEQSDAARLIDTLADTICFESEYEDDDDEDEDEDPFLKIQQELHELFAAQASVIEAFHQALDLLPPDRRYTLQTTTETPWKSEIYLSPKYYDYGKY